MPRVGRLAAVRSRGGLTIRLLPCHSVCTLQWRAPDQCVMVDYRGLCQQMVRAGRATRLAVEDSPTVTGGSPGHESDLADPDGLERQRGESGQKTHSEK